MTSQGIYYLIRALVALVAIPFHEAGHALAAWLLGDDTAKRQGRLSLNPFVHFDLLGTLCMVFAGCAKAPAATEPSTSAPTVAPTSAPTTAPTSICLAVYPLW